MTTYEKSTINPFHIHDKQVNKKATQYRRPFVQVLNVPINLVPVDKLQGNIRRFNSDNFTWIFPKELSVYTDIAFISNTKPMLHIGCTHQSATERDIFERGRIKLIAQFQ
jgi:hypothetical protein